jgi:hypothetical protein
MVLRVADRHLRRAVSPDRPRPCGLVVRGWRSHKVSPRREGAAGRAGGMAERPGLRPDEQMEIPFRRKTDAPRGRFSGSLRRVAVFGPYRSASDGQVGRRSRSLGRPGYPPRSSTPDSRPLGGPCAGPAPPACTGGLPLHPLPPPLRIAGRASLPCDGTGTIMEAVPARMARDAVILERRAESASWRRGIC